MYVLNDIFRVVTHFPLEIYSGMDRIEVISNLRKL
jgi:hypothetical protein